MYIQLLLNNHNCDTDLWPWGGEAIYRNGRYVGETTTTGYGFTFKKQVNCHFFKNILRYSIKFCLIYLYVSVFKVCLGFVQNFDEMGNAQKVTNEYVLSGDYEVDVGGIRYFKFGCKKCV